MKTFFVVLAVALSGCAKQADPGSSCTLDDGKTLDVTGRADGIYGVRGETVDAEPLISWQQLHLTEHGVEAESGKPWLNLTVSEEGAKKLEAFTSEPAGRSIATVAGGAVASHHKIREALKTNKLKISCCDPRACERLLERL